MEDLGIQPHPHWLSICTLFTFPAPPHQALPLQLPVTGLLDWYLITAVCQQAAKAQPTSRICPKVGKLLWVLIGGSVKPILLRMVRKERVSLGSEDSWGGKSGGQPVPGSMLSILQMGKWKQEPAGKLAALSIHLVRALTLRGLLKRRLPAEHCSSEYSHGWRQQCLHVLVALKCGFPVRWNCSHSQTWYRA